MDEERFMNQEQLKPIISEFNLALGWKIDAAAITTKEQLQQLVDQACFRGRSDLSKRIVMFARANDFRVGMPN